MAKTSGPPGRLRSSWRVDYLPAKDRWTPGQATAKTYVRPEPQGVPEHLQAANVFGSELVTAGRRPRPRKRPVGRRATCPVCGREAGIGPDGQLRAHSIPEERRTCWGLD